MTMKKGFSVRAKSSTPTQGKRRRTPPLEKRRDGPGLGPVSISRLSRLKAERVQDGLTVQMSGDQVVLTLASGGEVTEAVLDFAGRAG
jgi:hypothetical protein